MRFFLVALLLTTAAHAGEVRWGPSTGADGYQLGFSCLQDGSDATWTDAGNVTSYPHDWTTCDPEFVWLYAYNSTGQSPMVTATYSGTILDVGETICVGCDEVPPPDCPDPVVCPDPMICPDCPVCDDCPTCDAVYCDDLPSRTWERAMCHLMNAASQSRRAKYHATRAPVCVP